MVVVIATLAVTLPQFNMQEIASEFLPSEDLHSDTGVPTEIGHMDTGLPRHVPQQVHTSYYEQCT